MDMFLAQVIQFSLYSRLKTKLEQPVDRSTGERKEKRERGRVGSVLVTGGSCSAQCLKIMFLAGDVSSSVCVERPCLYRIALAGGKGKALFCFSLELRSRVT